MTLRRLALLAVPIYFAVGEAMTRISVGAFSLNAFSSLALLAALLLLGPIIVKYYRAVAPAFWLLTIWLALSFSLTILNPGTTSAGRVPLSLLATQQFLAWLLFIGSVMAGAWLSARRSSYESLPRALILVGCFWGLAVIVLRPASYVVAGFQVIGPRPMAAILLISFSIAYGRFFGIRQLRAGAAAAFLLIALVISQSRSATLAAAVAVVSIETSAVRFLKLRTWRGIAYAGVVACSSIALAWSYGPFRERVEPLINSPELVLAGGATTAVVATQGRSIAWPRLFAHAMEAPVIGHGMGTASAYTYSVTHNEHFSHPHNEYLRLLHDAGLIGLLSWLAGFLHTWTMARRVEDSAGSGQYRDAHALAAGIVGLIPAFLVLSLTDNIGFYTFVTVPFGILLGLIVAQRGRFLERPIQQSST